MIRIILDELKNIDKTIIKYISSGVKMSFGLCIIGIILLLSYNRLGFTYDIYKGGFILIRTGIIFASQCLGCGFITDKLKKNII